MVWHALALCCHKHPLLLIVVRLPLNLCRSTWPLEERTTPSCLRSWVSSSKPLILPRCLPSVLANRLRLSQLQCSTHARSAS